MIHICLTIDQNYAEYAEMCILSIIQQRNLVNKDDAYTFYILGNHVSTESLKGFKIFETLKNVTIFAANFHDILEDRINIKLKSCPHLTNTCWLRYFIPELDWFYDLPKVLYLDADISAHADVKCLWDEDMHDQPIAAVKDFGKLNVFGSPRSIENPDYSNYKSINTGVMLLDPKKLRQINFTQTCIDRTHRNPTDDQGIINEFMGDSIQFLNPCYNFSYHYYLLHRTTAYGDINRWNKTYGTCYKDMNELILCSVLWHFHGNKEYQKKDPRLGTMYKDWAFNLEQFKHFAGSHILFNALDENIGDRRE